MNFDEDLQNEVEKGILDNSLDGRSYASVFNSLKREPYQLPVNFADQLVTRLESQGSVAKDYLWLGLGLLSFVVVIAVTFAYLQPSFDFGVFKFMAAHSMLLIFGLFFILLVNVFDHQLIRRTRNLEERNYH